MQIVLYYGMSSVMISYMRNAQFAVKTSGLALLLKVTKLHRCKVAQLQSNRVTKFAPCTMFFVLISGAYGYSFGHLSMLPKFKLSIKREGGGQDRDHI